VQERAALAVEDRGGRPVRWPLIRLEPRRLEVDPAEFDAIVLTSPSAVRIFFDSCSCDRRRLPEFYTCGAGTDAALREYGVSSDVMPQSDFSAAGLVKELRGIDLRGRRVLRLRSAKAGPALARAVKSAGGSVRDVVLYDNVFTAPSGALPPFDDVFFASASAVESCIAQYGAAKLRGKGIYVMGAPTRQALPETSRKKSKILACI
jgi:uroporphyrinogen-III synthase